MFFSLFTKWRSGERERELVYKKSLQLKICSFLPCTVKKVKQCRAKQGEDKLTSVINIENLFSTFLAPFTSHHIMVTVEF